MRRMSRAGILATAAILLVHGNGRAAPAAADTAAMIRAIVRATVTGMGAQREVPRAPRFTLLVDPRSSSGVSWEAAGDLVPTDLSASGVTVRICEASCEPREKGEIRLSFQAPAYDSPDRASVMVEAAGIHPDDGWIPKRPWRALYRYRLERFGEEWFAVGVEPIVTG